jgi:small conductance mechanosensitive channel
MNDLSGKIQEWLTVYGFKILAAVIILVIGIWAAKWVEKIIKKILGKKNVDPMIVSFVGHVAYIGLIVFVVIAAIKKLGYDTTSFVAVIGAAGLAIGFALQGSLSNFAAGFLIIMFRPFKAGDYVEGAGTAGIVKEIQTFTTVLVTPDNKKVIIPNSKMMGDNITNYSAHDTRRVEIIAGVSYSDDLDKVRRVLEDIIKSDARVLDDPASMIAVKELANSSVNFVVRVWVKTADYWNVYFDLTEAIKKRFDAEDITFPFPQRDVHMYQVQ